MAGCQGKNLCIGLKGSSSDTETNEIKWFKYYSWKCMSIQMYVYCKFARVSRNKNLALANQNTVAEDYENCLDLFENKVLNLIYLIVS